MTITATGNTYSGGTLLDGGTVPFSNVNGLGSSGNIEFQADSTLQWGNPTAQWTQNLSSRLVIDAGVTATLDMGATAGDVCL